MAPILEKGAKVVRFRKLVLLLQALVKENVTMVGVVRVFLSGSKKCLYNRLVNNLHVLVVEEQPVVVALDQAHVVAMVWATPNVHHHREQRVLGLGARCIVSCVAQLQFQGEHYTVRQLLVTTQLLNVLEPLQV
jgi:hypothetical protein